MALEEFILDLCEESVNAALLVGYQALPSGISDNYARRFGYFKAIFMTYPRIHNPMPSRPVEGFTIKSNTLSLEFQSLLEMRD